MTEKIKDFVEHELKMLDKGIVATPNQDYLLQFTEANNGSNDYLLMQMAKNYGYKIALEVRTHPTLDNYHILWLRVTLTNVPFFL